MARWKRLFITGLSLFMLILLARPALALCCDYEAMMQRASGNYAVALNWLDGARFFNPLLDQTASYHIERGEAVYFSSNSEADESHIYLAAVYSEQKDYLDAYTQIVMVWHAHKTTPW